MQKVLIELKYIPIRLIAMFPYSVFHKLVNYINRKQTSVSILQYV